jgi:hypothetical protein
MPPLRAQHVAHPVERLVNDPVMVGIEGGLLLCVRESPDVVGAAMGFGPAEAFEADPLVILTPSLQKSQLLRPP